MTTTKNNAETTTMRLDNDLRKFLRECARCQCLGIAAWASRILRAREMAVADMERCLKLGFEF
ncbi:hypothetical protein RAS1_14160 [Phycisphaerae bacterium RAS1]|nr:hypothetical protein RAS1_14160 [Phycisphaerae bacterium RAS1]